MTIEDFNHIIIDAVAPPEIAAAISLRSSTKNFNHFPFIIMQYRMNY